MTKLAFASLLALAVVAGAYSASRAQTTCTTTTFMGTATTRCADGSTATSSTFMGTTTTTIQPGYPQVPSSSPCYTYAATMQGMVKVPC